jgi:replicative DNA helicase
MLTGYSFLDDATGGLRSGELLLIGAETGAGKSLLLMNMAIQMWMQKNTIDSDSFSNGYNILYFSLEMPFKPCLNRILSRLSSNPSKAIRNAKLTTPEAEKLKQALRFINKYPNQFEIIDIPRGATMETIEQMYEEAKAHFQPHVVVIDYLGLMEYEESGEMEDWLKLGHISAKMHEFSRVHNVIVLSALQLNRPKSNKEEDRIGLHRIGRSSMIMQNANIGIQIETRQNEKDYPDMIYHIIKNRDANTGKGILIKNLSCGTLVDSAANSEESDVSFEERNPDDISGQIEALDI